jgi:hypothetical protein
VGNEALSKALCLDERLTVLENNVDRINEAVGPLLGQMLRLEGKVGAFCSGDQRTAWAALDADHERLKARVDEVLGQHEEDLDMAAQKVVDLEDKAASNSNQWSDLLVRVCRVEDEIKGIRRWQDARR